MPRKATRNPSGSGTIRQRSDGTWEGRCTLGRDPGTGKQIQKSVYGKTQAEAAQKLRRAVAEIDQGTYMEPAKISVGDWFDTWIAEYLGGVKESTRAQYAYQVRVNIRPALGAVKLSALTPPMIQRLYNTAQRRGLSPKSVRNLHGVMHRALEQAVKLGYIRTNPCLACELPRVEKKEMQTIPGDRIRAFMQAIQQDEYAALFYVDVFTGLRQGEILGLTWDCVDFQRGRLTICKQLQKERGKGGQYRFVSLKNDKQRTLTPAPSVMTLLRSVQRQQKENHLKAGSLWQNPLNLVFTNALGGHLASETVYKHLKRIARDLGCPDLRFHDLRHPYVKQKTKLFTRANQQFCRQFQFAYPGGQ